MYSFDQFSIFQECWDKDRFSDDFMGSLQFTEQDLVQFQEGPRWFRLQHVNTGEILIVMKKIGRVEEELEWSHLDEASRPLHLVGESKSTCVLTLQLHYAYFMHMYMYTCSTTSGPC